MSRNFEEKRLTVAVFLNATKALDTAWVDGHLYKLAILNFPSYLVKTISSYPNSRTFEVSFQTAIPTSLCMRAEVAQGGIISPVLFSLYVNDMPSPSRHVDLALYAEDTAAIATSCQPALLVTYLETYFSDLERWLSEWRIVINVPKGSAMFFAKTGRRIPKPRTVQLFGQPIQRFDNVPYLGVTLDKRLAWSMHIVQVRKKKAQRRSALSIKNGVLLYKQLIRPTMDYACPVWRTAARSHTKKLQLLQSKCLRIATNTPWYTGNWTPMSGSLNRNARNNLLATPLATSVARPNVVKGKYGFELRRRWYVSITEVTRISAIGVINVQFLKHAKK